MRGGNGVAAAEKLNAILELALDAYRDRRNFLIKRLHAISKSSDCFLDVIHTEELLRVERLPENVTQIPQVVTVELQSDEVQTTEPGFRGGQFGFRQDQRRCLHAKNKRHRHQKNVPHSKLPWITKYHTIIGDLTKNS